MTNEQREALARKLGVVCGLPSELIERRDGKGMSQTVADFPDGVIVSHEQLSNEQREEILNAWNSWKEPARLSVITLPSQMEYVRLSVFAVTRGYIQDGSFNTLAVFSTKEKALAFKAEYDAKQTSVLERADVTEWLLDVTDPKKNQIEVEASEQ
mgnify:CR=1 FL=1